ncbi:MAG: hypothetical protein LQ339_005209 [Xanthoria mediterranea]|nr:MAG: hypothetical protein LQ339_005209 [Xanthoria mediterranea]
MAISKNLLPLLITLLSTVASSATLSPSYLPQPSITPTTVSPSCTTPTGFSNQVVPIPNPLATPSYEVDPAFAAQHIIFLFGELNGLFSRATIGTFCLEQCISYKPPANATNGGPCLSFNVNIGRPIPVEANGDAPRWYCSGFDAFLSPEVFVKRDVPGSFLHSQSVNRTCEGTFRAY